MIDQESYRNSQSQRSLSQQCENKGEFLGVDDDEIGDSQVPPPPLDAFEPEFNEENPDIENLEQQLRLPFI